MMEHVSLKCHVYSSSLTGFNLISFGNSKSLGSLELARGLSTCTVLFNVFEKQAGDFRHVIIKTNN